MSEAQQCIRFWEIDLGCRICLMTQEQIEPYLKAWQSKLFAKNAYVFPNLSENEKAATEALRLNMGNPLQLAFGVFKDEVFVGWHVGNQRSATEFYMRNSAILPEYRRQGLYSAPIKTVVAYCREAFDFRVGMIHPSDRILKSIARGHP